MTEAVVLAGGLGTRLRPALTDLPKPLAPIAGRPFLAYLFERLAVEGVRRVVIAAGYRGEAVRAAFGGEFASMALHYEIEAEPLGTGGALRAALARVAFPAFALNGDTYAEVDLRAMARAHEAACAELSIAVRRLPAPDRYGSVEVAAGRVIGFAASSPTPAPLANCGLYLFARNLLADPALPPRFSFETDFLAPRVKALRPLAFESDGNFIDIGVPADYARAQSVLPRWHATHAAAS